PTQHSAGFILFFFVLFVLKWFFLATASNKLRAVIDAKDYFSLHQTKADLMGVELQFRSLSPSSTMYE
ncbi:hypothetical protein L9F63_016610, partial [Diploptera punctata]